MLCVLLVTLAVLSRPVMCTSVFKGAIHLSMLRNGSQVWHSMSCGHVCDCAAGTAEYASAADTGSAGSLIWCTTVAEHIQYLQWQVRVVTL